MEIAIPKSITEQIEDLQAENERLKEYEKLCKKAVKTVLKINPKMIEKMSKKSDEKHSEFENKICLYFNLYSTAEKEEFLSIMCTDSSLRYFNSKRKNPVATQQG